MYLFSFNLAILQNNLINYHTMKTKQLLFVLLATLFMLATSCSKNEDMASQKKLITLSTTSATLHNGETYKIQAQCDNTITYSSGNEYHAKVSSSGVVTAQYVGNTTITLKSKDDTKTFSVNVSPRSNLYPKPNINFGETRSSVISKLGTPASTTSNAIGYTSYSANAPILAVLFDNNNCVSAYSLLIYSTYASELSTFIRERYVYVTYSDGLYLFINSLSASTATMIVGYGQYNSNYSQSIYIPYDKKDAYTEDLDAILKELTK